MRTWFLLLLLCACGLRARAQYVPDSLFDAITRDGIASVYNLDFARADSEFHELVRLNPHHPSGYFLLAMVQWWQILIDIDSDERDEQFFSSLDHVIDICDSLLDRNPNDVTAILFKGGSIGFRGRLKFHRGDYFAAANAGRKALPLVEQAHALDPGNDDVLLGTGMYNYYAEVIPNEYPYLKPLLLFVPPGDKKKGLDELTRASERGKYTSIETTYFLLQIYYFYEHDYSRALSLARALHARFPANMLFHCYVGRCYASLNDWPKADSMFTEVAARAQEKQKGYGPGVEREAEYYRGAAAVNARDYESALRHLYRCDALCRTLDRDGPSGFMVMANMKMGNVYDLTSQRELAVKEYNKVLGMKEYQNSYALAQQFLRTPYAQ